VLTVTYIVHKIYRKDFMWSFLMRYMQVRHSLLYYLLLVLCDYIRKCYHATPSLVWWIIHFKTHKIVAWNESLCCMYVSSKLWMCTYIIMYVGFLIKLCTKLLDIYTHVCMYIHTYSHVSEVVKLSILVKYRSWSMLCIRMCECSSHVHITST